MHKKRIRAKKISDPVNVSNDEIIEERALMQMLRSVSAAFYQGGWFVHEWMAASTV